MEKKISEICEKNEFYGDVSCFFAIKASAVPRRLSKLVQMMRLVKTLLEKSSEFLKISKSLKNNPMINDKNNPLKNNSMIRLRLL